MFGNGPGTFIGRFEHHAIQCLFHSHLLADITGDGRSTAVALGNGVLRKGHGVSELRMLKSDKCCHDFCDAGRIVLGVSLFIVKNCSAVDIHQYC